jgi:hypothetical protein
MESTSWTARLVPGSYTLEALRQGAPAVSRAFQVGNQSMKVKLGT